MIRGIQNCRKNPSDLNGHNAGAEKKTNPHPAGFLAYKSIIMIDHNAGFRVCRIKAIGMQTAHNNKHYIYMLMYMCVCANVYIYIYIFTAKCIYI